MLSASTEPQHLGAAKEAPHGLCDLRNQAAPANHQAAVHVVRFQVCALQSVLQRREDGAGHQVLRIASVQHVGIEERLQHLLELDGAERGRLEAQGGPVRERTRVQSRVLPDQGGACAIVTLESLQPGDLLTEANLQCLGRAQEGRNDVPRLCSVVQCAGIEPVLPDQLRQQDVDHDGTVDVAAAEPMVAGNGERRGPDRRAPRRGRQETKQSDVAGPAAKVEHHEMRT